MSSQPKNTSYAKFGIVVVIILSLISFIGSIYLLRAPVNYIRQNNYIKIDAKLVDVIVSAGDDGDTYTGIYEGMVDGQTIRAKDFTSQGNESRVPQTAVICVNPNNYNDCFIAVSLGSALFWGLLGIIDLGFGVIFIILAYKIDISLKKDSSN